MLLFENRLDVNKPTIGGLDYFPEFIDETTHRKLVHFADSQPWSHIYKRRTQSFGKSYFPGGSEGILPPLLADLAGALARQGIFSEAPSQVSVNEYFPGQAIAPHVDKGNPALRIAILSLISGISFHFEDLYGENKQEMYLEKNSLLVISGEARQFWKHGILPRKTDVIHGIPMPRYRRLSFTFRGLEKENFHKN